MTEPLSHFDPTGAARMVAVTDKPETRRTAVARAEIHMAEGTLARIREGGVGKGDVLGVAQVAAISGAKRTSDVVPLCHPIRITEVDVRLTPADAPPRVEIEVRVEAVDRTGPEMEALTAATTAALTIYDMCKAMDRGMTITGVRLQAKSGGKSGGWTHPGDAP